MIDKIEWDKAVAATQKRGKAAKRKGKVGEREWAALCREYGFEARRGQQFSGASGDPDVVTNVPGIHFEVKRTETLHLWGAIKQAEDDALL